MNVLLTYNELGFRGGERLFATLSKGLIKTGNKVTIVVGRTNKNRTDFPNAVKIVKPPSFFNYVFKNNWIFATVSFPVTLTNIILHAKNSDVIYAGESFVTLWPSVIASKLLRKKLVLSVFELGKRYKTPAGVRGVINTIWDKVNNFFVKKITHAVTINSSLIPWLTRDFGIKNVYSVPAGIDFDIFKNPHKNTVTKKYNLSGKKIILIQGTLHPQKRQDLAIETLKEVKKEIPNAVLIIGGGGDKKYLNKLKHLASALDLKKDVVFTGFIKDTSLKDYYSAANACLMCGPIAGLTIIEALYFGRLTVYPTSGNPPLGPVEEYGLGVVTKHATKEEFATKLIDILKNSTKFSAKTNREREFVKEKFSQKHFTESTFKLLQTSAMEK